MPVSHAPVKLEWQFTGSLFIIVLQTSYIFYHYILAQVNKLPFIAQSLQYKYAVRYETWKLQLSQRSRSRGRKWSQHNWPLTIFCCLIKVANQKKHFANEWNLNSEPCTLGGWVFDIQLTFQGFHNIGGGTWVRIWSRQRCGAGLWISIQALRISHSVFWSETGQHSSQPNCFRSTSAPRSLSFLHRRVYEQLHSFTISVTCPIRVDFLSVDLRGRSKLSHMTLSSFTVKRDNAPVLTRSQML